MKATVPLLLGLLLAACASAPVYRPADSDGDVGYRATRLTQNQYRVVFHGNRSTSAEAVRDYALLRAAELTLENGYDWFEVVSADNSTQNRDRLATTTEIVPATRVTRRCGLLGCTTSVAPDYVGMRVLTREIDDYHTALVEFTMGRGEPRNPERVYDAAALARSIRDSRMEAAS